MTWQILLSFLLLMSLGYLLSIIMVILLKGTFQEHKYFVLMLFSLVIYCAGSILEVYVSTVDLVLIAYRIQYSGISFFPAFLILFALTYVKKNTEPSKRFKLLLYAVSILTLFIVYSTDYHNLMHIAPRMDFSGPFPVLAFERGPWYWVHVAYINLSVLTANIIFLKIWVRSAGRFRKQAAILFLSTLIPWIFFIVYIFRLVNWPIDFNPVTFTVAAFFLYIAISRENFGNIAPIAREMVFEKLYDAALVLDTRRKVVDYNSAAGALFPLPNQLIGRQLSAVIEASNATGFPSDFEAPADDTVHHEVHIGDDVYDVCMIDLITKRRRTVGHVLTFRNVTGYKILARRLTRMAHTDELTGIHNRRAFVDLLSKELNRARRNNSSLALLLIDIDHFKVVNDTYGHAAGDKVLRTLAHTLPENLRSFDLLARYGGEEFAICLPGVSQQDAVQSAERIRCLIQEMTVPFDSDVHIKITVSIGVASPTAAYETDDQLMIKADKALYKAKAAGRNCVVSSDAGIMHQQ